MAFGVRADILKVFLFQSSERQPTNGTHVLPSLVVSGALVAPVVAVANAARHEPLHDAAVELGQDGAHVGDGALAAAAGRRRVEAVEQDLQRIVLFWFVVVRSPFRAKHHVVVQYTARWMKCPLPPPP